LTPSQPKQFERTVKNSVFDRFSTQLDRGLENWLTTAVLLVLLKRFSEISEESNAPTRWTSAVETTIPLDAAHTSNVNVGPGNILIDKET